MFELKCQRSEELTHESTQRTAVIEQVKGVLKQTKNNVNIKNVHTDNAENIATNKNSAG